MYKISATIGGGFGDLDAVCAFDPTKVVARLKKEFAGVEVDPTDHAWRDYKNFLRMGHTAEEEAGRPTALGVAAADARRRGPLWQFRVPCPGGGWVNGTAERHTVRFRSELPFPESLRTQLLRFVEGLRFAPCVRVEGDTTQA